MAEKKQVLQQDDKDAKDINEEQVEEIKAG